MAKDIRVHAYSATAHLQTCMLHGDKKTAMCSGTLKRKGGNCVNKAVGPLQASMMPMCRIHRDQLKKAAWCRAPLPCGFDCSRICLWKPHGFPLCPDHHQHPMTCYLLKIPIEMRLRIYGYLLPDKPIPARYGNSRCLTSGGGLVYTALLRVNHQIHDEAVHLLYAASAFTIELGTNGLVMCNSFKKSPGGNHALQDYQMQLMRLEQQNKKRLMMARLEQDMMTNGGSSSSSNPPMINRQMPNNGPPIIPYTSGPVEPAWYPPLSMKYFNMIRSFIVEVVFPPPNEPNFPGRHARVSPEEEAKALESKLYDYCDHLHKLVGRFRLVHRPLARLQIVLKLGKTEMRREEAMSAAQVLLRPFQRLRNIGKPEVPSILVKGFDDHEIELLNQPAWTSSTMDRNFHDYLNCWLSDLSSPELFLTSPVFKAYWQLERLLSGIKKHHVDVKFFLFTRLLHTGRVAREADDLPSFKAVWDQVLDIWFDYVNDQRRFRSNVSLCIDAIDSTVNEDF